MAKGEYKVPYDSAGNLQHYPTPFCDWQGNEVFKASLRLDRRINSGYSAKYVQWHDEHTGKVYPMFIKDLIDTILSESIYNGVIHEGYWRVQKRGANYGIRKATIDEIK